MIAELPTKKDLESRNIPNASEFLEIQAKAQEAFKKSLSFQKHKLSLINGYSLKPDILGEAFDFYRDLIMQKGDKRNSYLYGEAKPKLRKNLAKAIGSERYDDVAIGINASTFVSQVVSEYWGSGVKVLTTDGEFYGTVRFLNRLKEIPGNVITEVTIEDFDSFPTRIYEAACKDQYDLIIMSHIFFKSGNVVQDLEGLISLLKGKCKKIVIDGSCAFGNIPIQQSLGKMIDEVYYIGGVYKFVGAGEGFAFMSLPKSCKDRPVLTGWLFGEYTDESHYYSNPLHYEDGGERYSSSTLEASIWVRVNMILEYYEEKGFTIEMKSFYTTTLQDYLIKKIEEAGLSFLSRKNLKNKLGKIRPLQTCFEIRENEKKFSAQNLVNELNKHEIEADFRGNTLRLCVAIYHTVFDIDRLVDCLKQIDGISGGNN